MGSLMATAESAILNVFFMTDLNELNDSWDMLIRLMAGVDREEEREICLKINSVEGKCY